MPATTEISDKQAQRVLIAGCGDVGTRVAQLLHSSGAEVWGLKRSGAPVGAGITLLQADLTDANSLRKLPGRIDQVVYLPTPDTRDRAAYYHVFVQGLQNLLQALDKQKLQRIVFVSSSAVYGEHNGDWVDENTPASPLGFNGEVLLEAEQWLAGTGYPATVLRLAGLYGPGRTELFERLRSGRARVRSEPPFWSNRVHVDDAAAAIVHVLGLREPATLYLGVDNTPLPIAQLYGELAHRLGAPAPAEGPAPQGIGSKRLSNARLLASGFSPRWPDSRGGYAALMNT
ncbi:SDR family oxidoreductase [Allopusillimonas ginsengisoli]|uniref:SDR family oxidoreductase n=1 Tax=Allopusillimonas ginsengisoli TaxID=453575 RepID=UPI0039C25DEF